MALLWLPVEARHRVRSPGADPLLIALGAEGADAEGCFELTSGLPEARQAVVSHRCGLVDDSVVPELGLSLWCAMKADPSTGAYLGPPVFARPSAFTPPALPVTGLAIGEVVAAYAAASPVAIGLRSDRRIAVRPFAEAPPPVWRRRVPRPRLLPWPRDAERWQRFRRDLVAVPTAEVFGAWVRSTRRAHWARYTLWRLFDDLRRGAVGSYEPNGAAIPWSYWCSDIELDVDLGAIYVRRDSRMPIVAGVRCYPCGAEPPEIAAWREVCRRTGKPAGPIPPGRRIEGSGPREPRHLDA